MLVTSLCLHGPLGRVCQGEGSDEAYKRSVLLDVGPCLSFSSVSEEAQMISTSLASQMCYLTPQCWWQVTEGTNGHFSLFGRRIHAFIASLIP